MTAILATGVNAYIFPLERRGTQKSTEDIVGGARRVLNHIENNGTTDMSRNISALSQVRAQRLTGKCANCVSGHRPVSR
jgi:hypothetical protein